MTRKKGFGFDSIKGYRSSQSWSFYQKPKENVEPECFVSEDFDESPPEGRGRREGTKVLYSPQQAYNYKSQWRRYFKALSLRPASMEKVDDDTEIYRFASCNAPLGYWEVTVSGIPEGFVDAGEDIHLLPSIRFFQLEGDSDLDLLTWSQLTSQQILMANVDADGRIVLVDRLTSSGEYVFRLTSDRRPGLKDEVTAWSTPTDSLNLNFSTDYAVVSSINRPQLINYDSAGTIPTFSLVSLLGTAAFSPSTGVRNVVLNSSVTGAIGHLWHPSPLRLSGLTSFATHFRWRSNAANAGVAFYFVLQSRSVATSLPFSSGYGGIYRSLGIRFSTTANNSIRVLKNGDVNVILATATPLFVMSAEALVYTWVDYSAISQQLNIYVATTGFKPETPTLSYQIDLSFLGTETYAGFCSGCDTGSNPHTLTFWTFSRQPQAGSTITLIEGVEEALAYNAQRILLEHPAFTGIKNDTGVVGDVLQLVTANYFDQQAGLFDSQTGLFEDINTSFDATAGLFDDNPGTFDETGSVYNVVPEGEYLRTVDLGEVCLSTIAATVDAIPVRQNDFFDLTSGLFDSRIGLFEGTPITDTSATLYISTSTDGVIFSPWTLFSPGSYSARFLRFSLRLASGNVMHNIQVRIFTVDIDLPERTETGAFTTSSTAMTFVPYATGFREGPLRGVTIPNCQVGDYIVFGSESAAGFEIEVRDVGDNRVARAGEYLAKGFGSL